MAFAYHQQAAQPSSTEQLKCSACRVNVLPNERNLHYRSDWHRYNLKRKCVNMEPIEKSVFEAKLRSIISSGQQMNNISNKKKKKALNKTKQNNYDTLVNNDQWSQFQESQKYQDTKSFLNYKCNLCNKTFKTHQQCLSHLKTKKHKLEFRKYHKNLRDQQQEEINVYHATNVSPQQESNNNNNLNPSMDNLIPLDKLKPLLTIENNPFITIKQAKMYNKQRGIHNNSPNNDDESKLNDNNNNNNNEHIEGPPQKQEEQQELDDNDKQQDRIAIDPCKECLFCTQTFDSQELCLKHMQQEHGFFIPLPKRCIDLDELLKLAGSFIGEYHQCVWCWRIFKSVRGCQAHMRHTGHCKLQLEYSSNITYSKIKDENDNAMPIVNENDDSPFVKYFDFDKIIVDSDIDINDNEENGGREIMIREKRHIADINDYDELVRNDGTVIGHRDNMIVYKQKHRNLSKYHETQTEEQIIAQINNPQRKLKLQEMEREKNSLAFEQSGAKQQAKGGKIKDSEAMHLQTRAHKVSYQNWVNLQKSKQLY